MSRSSLEGSQHFVDKTTYTNALAAWTEASFDLFVNFKKLKRYLHQNAVPRDAERERSSYIGQCPREQVVALFTAIERELDRLLQEVEHLSSASQTDYRIKHPRLIAQTALLNQLNQRATDTLFLTTLSAT